MDLAGFESFAINAAIGLLVLLGTLGVIHWLATPKPLAWVIKQLKDLPAVLSIGLLLVLVLVGLVIDNAADAIDDKFQDYFLPSDSGLRAEVLFKQQNQKCTPEPLAKELAACGAFERFGGTHGASIQQQILSTGQVAASADQRREVAKALYYAAKSRVYRESSYMEDMQRIQRNISAMRSLALSAVLLAGTAIITLVLGMSLSPSKREWKTGGLAIAVLAVLAIVYFTSRWNFELEEKDFDIRAYGYFASILANP